MATELYYQSFGGVLAVEITREHKARQATLTIRNGAEIKGEIRQRPHYTKMDTTSVPETAYALFTRLQEHLEKRGFHSNNPTLTNLPELPPDQTKFSATATIELGNLGDEALQSDKKLRDIFKLAIGKFIKDFGEQRFLRPGSGRRWSNQKGGRAAGL